MNRKEVFSKLFCGGAIFGIILLGFSFLYAAEVSFSEHVIFSGLPAGWSSRLTYFSDIDGDGDPDVIASTRFSGGPVWWFENSGGASPTFTTHQIDNHPDCRAVFATDLDGDGDTDLLSASALIGAQEIRWYENNGAVNPNFSFHVIPSTAIDYFALHADDIDGDGDMDIITGSGPTGPSSSQVAWHENIGGTPLKFVEHELSRNTNWPNSIETSDLDGDGDVDIIAGSLEFSGDPGEIVWYENDGNASPNFIQRFIAEPGGGIPSVDSIDLDGDGDVDIIAANAIEPGGNIIWYENNGGSLPVFTERIVNNNVDGRFVFPTDIDNDGDFDILAAQHIGPVATMVGQFAYYENKGGSPLMFAEHIIATIPKPAPPSDLGAEHTLAADFDNDGDMDVLARESAWMHDARILWYENSVQLPTVPGFIVEPYAQQSDLRPTKLSFDFTGVLYVGNNGAYVPIWQIGVGGSPINDYGDPIFDPDAVVIDETGDVASIAGSVLVGSGGGGGNLATIYEILPDETTNILFQAGNLSNPQDMIIDDTGRLLIADAFRGAVLQSTGSAPTVLFSQTLPNEVEVDTSGRIFTGSPSGIQIHDSNGNLIDGSFVTGIDIWGLGFGPSSPPWDGHLFAVSFQSKLYRIDEIGTVTEIGTGFNNPLDLKFGPDGALYVSDFGNNVIYRIVPKDLIKINGFVTFEPDPSTYLFTPDPTDCQAGAVGKFTFDATLTNISAKKLFDLLVEVIELANNNLLLTDIGLIGKGERFEVPKIDDYADGTLVPDENVDVPFTVCLNNIDPFRFFVDVYGATDVIDLNKGLVASYPFNGNANDESGNGNDGTVHGTQLINDRFGNPNSAYSFESDQDYISVSNLSLVGTSFAIAAWVRIDNYSEEKRDFIRRGNHVNYMLGVWNNHAQFGYSADPPPNYDPNIVDGNEVINLNEWTFIVGLYDRDVGITKLYVNGQFDDNNPNALDPHDPGGALEIGNWYGTRNSWNYPTFSGDIDDIRIYDRALSEAEIKALFNLGN